MPEEKKTEETVETPIEEVSKTEELKKEVLKEKQERKTKFLEEVQKLQDKYKCDFVPYVIVTGAGNKPMLEVNVLDK